MTTITENSTGEQIVSTTIGELAAFWKTDPDEWGMLDPIAWRQDDPIRFREQSDGTWHMERQHDDGYWRVAVEQAFTLEELPPVGNPPHTPTKRKGYEGITISYQVGNATDWARNCGRLSPDDILLMYSQWLSDALETAFDHARIEVGYHPPRNWHYENEISISGARDEGEEEEVREIIESIVDTFEFQGFVEVPTVEELQAAPYLYQLPSSIVRMIVAGEDPFEPTGNNWEILMFVERFDGDAPPSDMAKILKRIVESGGELDYLWEVEMLPSTIGAGAVHEPIARAVLEGLNPRPIYDAWKQLQDLNDARKELRKAREHHHAEMLSLRSRLRIVEGLIAEDDRLIALNTTEITHAVDVHNKRESPQWDAYRVLSAEAQREREYRRIIATFDALLEADDPRVRRSNSGSPVFVTEDGSSVEHPGMGLGAGVDKCPTQWFLQQFEERGIALIELEFVD